MTSPLGRVLSSPNERGVNLGSIDAVILFPTVLMFKPSPSMTPWVRSSRMCSGKELMISNSVPTIRLASLARSRSSTMSRMAPRTVSIGFGAVAMRCLFRFSVRQGGSAGRWTL